MANKIQIGLDANEVKRSLFEISSVIERSFGRGKSFNIFTPETRKFLAGEATKAIGNIGEEMKKLGKYAEYYHNRLKKINETDLLNLQAKEKLLKIEIQRAKYANELSRLEKAKQTLGGAVSSPMTVRDVSTMAMEKMGGMGVMGATALGGLGLAAGLALKIGKMAFSEFEASVPQRLALMGRGIKDVSGTNPYLNGALGFKPSEIRAAQEQSIGIFGVGASQLESKEFQKNMKFARMTGFDANQVQGAFAGVQSQGGFGQANRTAEEFRATIFSNKLEHALGPYFEAMQDILSQINDNGLGLNAEAFDSIAKIAGAGDQVSAQQATKLIGGLDNFIKNAQGGPQALLMQAYAAKGIGRGTFGGAQSALEFGLFGGGTGKQLEAARGRGLLTSQDISMITSLGFGGEGASKKRAGAIVEQLETQLKRFPLTVGPNATKEEAERAKEEQWVARGRFLMAGTGTKNVTEAYEAFNTLKQISKTLDPKKREELLKQYEKDFGEKDVPKIMETSEGHLAQIQANTAASLEKLGKDIAPAVIEIQKLLVTLLGGAASTVEGWKDIASGKANFWGNVGDWISGGTKNPKEQLADKIQSGGFSEIEMKQMFPSQRSMLQDVYQEEISRINEQINSAKGTGWEKSRSVELATERRDKLQEGLDALVRYAAEKAKADQEANKIRQEQLQTAKQAAGKPKAEKGGRPPAKR